MFPSFGSCLRINIAYRLQAFPTSAPRHIVPSRGMATAEIECLFACHSIHKPGQVKLGHRPHILALFRMLFSHWEPQAHRISPCVAEARPCPPSCRRRYPPPSTEISHAERQEAVRETDGFDGWAALEACSSASRRSCRCVGFRVFRDWCPMGSRSTGSTPARATGVAPDCASQAPVSLQLGGSFFHQRGYGTVCRWTPM